MNSYPPLPDEIEAQLRRGRRLEGWSLFWLGTVILVMYLTLGSSQAMRTAWIEDMLSLIPPALVIATGWIERRPPTRRFPAGFHRAGSLAFFGASVVLTALGGWLLVDCAVSLLRAEHPTIGSGTILGQTVWLGWLMMAALAYSVVPPVILGRRKLQVARATYDKVMLTDAKMNKADWQTGLAGIAGIFGIAFEIWWADAAAAALISLSILKDGVTNLRIATAELLDSEPRALDSSGLSADAEAVRAALSQNAAPGARAAAVRIRESGRYLHAETSGECGEEALARGRAALGRNGWRLLSVAISPDRTGDRDAPAPSKLPID